LAPLRRGAFFVASLCPMRPSSAIRGYASAKVGRRAAPRKTQAHRGRPMRQLGNVTARGRSHSRQTIGNDPGASDLPRIRSAAASCELTASNTTMRPRRAKCSSWDRRWDSRCCGLGPDTYLSQIGIDCQALSADSVEQIVPTAGHRTAAAGDARATTNADSGADRERRAVSSVMSRVAQVAALAALLLLCSPLQAQANWIAGMGRDPLD
jgi:hypothetical protein